MGVGIPAFAGMTAEKQAMFSFLGVNVTL